MVVNIWKAFMRLRITQKALFALFNIVLFQWETLHELPKRINKDCCHQSNDWTWPVQQRAWRSDKRQWLYHDDLDIWPHLIDARMCSSLHLHDVPTRATCRGSHSSPGRLKAGDTCGLLYCHVRITSLPVGQGHAGDCINDRSSAAMTFSRFETHLVEVCVDNGKDGTLVSTF